MELLLDSSIRDWVLIPIIVVVLLSGMLRVMLSHLMDPKKDPEKDDVVVTQAVMRSQKLRQNYSIVPESAFKIRRSFFCKPQTGFLYKEFENTAMANFMDPTSQLDMIKKNAAYGITTMLLFSWVSSFCSGFILARVPFPLTQKFRGMTQRGVELDALDVTYVSSSSLYFLALFGMNGILSLIMGDVLAGKDKIQNLAMPMMGAGPAGKDFGKIMTAERENLDLVNYKFALDGIEEYFLKKF
ncbi:unnamed protein product [Blepharisma stoltei]|uniref:ER membrane protein complex subunit 3 n=1 Tax=Blepharisma stoltei TaxID=1481888 RepID=A0AAU9JT36_9CILI|nr:unnamed protein product [Blepharisma stoltei]